jgi:hypothetical protein
MATAIESRDWHLIKSGMKSYAKILFSVLTAVIFARAFAADQPAFKKSAKNPECFRDCGKSCYC